MAISKLPAIPEIEDAAELISLVANSKLYKERMEKLVDIYQKIKAEGDQYNNWKSIADYNDAADSKMAAANAKMSEAGDILAKAKVDAEAITKAAVQREFNINKGMRELEQSISQRETQVANVGREQEKRFAECVSRETIAMRMRNEATVALARAQAIQSDYQDRLEKLKGFAA